MNLRAPVLAALVAVTATFFGAAAFAQGSYSLEEYVRLTDAANTAVGVSEALDPGSDGYAEAREQAFETQRAVYHYLNGWMRSGTLPNDSMAGAEADQWLLLVNTAILAAQMGRCSTAQSITGLMHGLLDASRPERQAGYEAAVIEAETCLDTLTTGDIDSGRTDDGDARPEGGRRSQRSRRLGGLLTVVGVAAFTGGWILDWQSARGPRAEFDDLRAGCAAGDPCDYDRARELHDQIAGATAPIIALVVAGGLAAATGTLMLVLSGGSHEEGTEESHRSPSLSPRVRLDGVEFLPMDGGGQVRFGGTF